ncbi:MAG TPA: GtrA family protein, partial [Myxococcaceae bacterium]|nr:GtrA family protein [Myxococcaceae bacterium]
MNIETDLADSRVQSPPRRQRGLLALLKWCWHSWATRSLAVGAAATVLDVAVLLVCVKVFRLPNPVGAMVGVLFGSTFTFFANRHFAFRDHNPNLAPQAAKFVLSTIAAMLVHAQVVYVFADRLDV